MRSPGPPKSRSGGPGERALAGKGGYRDSIIATRQFHADKILTCTTMRVVDDFWGKSPEFMRLFMELLS
jgi:hypothetical protein